MVAITVLLVLVASACNVDGVDVANYLSQYGYFNAHAYNSNLTESLLLFQKTYQLKPTGSLDDETVKLMETPRCGNHDTGSAKYAQDSAWGHKDLSYYFHNYSPDLSSYAIRTAIARSLKFWSDVTPLTFYERKGGDINIAFGPQRHYDSKGVCRENFDGKGKVLAHAYFPEDGRIHFDESETWTVNDKQGTNLLWVSTHEMGHILGLHHDTDNKAAIMYPYYRSYTPNMQLHYNDIRRIQSLYGRSGSGGGGGGSTGGGGTGGGSCTDTSSLCGTWAKLGLCSKSSSMKRKCCRSC